MQYPEQNSMFGQCSHFRAEQINYCYAPKLTVYYERSNEYFRVQSSFFGRTQKWNVTIWCRNK